MQLIPQKKALEDATLPELRTFATQVENLTFEDNRDANKMSTKELVSRLRALNYAHIYVLPHLMGDTADSFDVELFVTQDQLQNLGLTAKDERWFKIRISDHSDVGGKSKNIPVPVGYHDGRQNYTAFIPRGVVRWVRGRFVHCLMQAVETHTIQSDPTLKYSESTRKQRTLRYPFTALAVGGLVKDGVPDLAPGEDIILQDKSAKMARKRMEAARRGEQLAA